MSLGILNKIHSNAEWVNGFEGKLKRTLEKNLQTGKVKIALEENLQTALKIWTEFDSSSDDEDQVPELDCSRLAYMVFDFADAQALNKVQSVEYCWFSIDDQYFLRTDKSLGKGSYGEVYRGFTYRGDPCAIKIGRVFQKEVDCLRRLSTDNRSEKSSINRMIAADHETSVVVMELADGDLEDLIQDGYLNRKEKLILIRGILSGLREIAAKNIIHSDLKPDNVFVMEREGYFAAKIGDFGKSFQEGKEFVGGAYGFRPPEAFFYSAGGKPPSPDHINKVDIWAAMIIFNQLAPDLLSPEFQERFEGYSGMRGEISDETKGLPKILYHEEVASYFEKIRSMCNGGLFSDLQPVRRMDRLVQAMSMIDPRERVSAQGALNLFDCLFTRKPPSAADLDLDEAEGAV